MLERTLMRLSTWQLAIGVMFIVGGLWGLVIPSPNAPNSWIRIVLGGGFSFASLPWFSQARKTRRAELTCERRDRGECEQCGYSLTANTTGVCPECGDRPLTQLRNFPTLR